MKSSWHSHSYIPGEGSRQEKHPHGNNYEKPTLQVFRLASIVYASKSHCLQPDGDFFGLLPLMSNNMTSKFPFTVNFCCCLFFPLNIPFKVYAGELKFKTSCIWANFLFQLTTATSRCCLSRSLECEQLSGIAGIKRKPQRTELNSRLTLALLVFCESKMHRCKAVCSHECLRALPLI